MIKEQFQQLLAKPMDRKEFLKHLGVGALAVTGVAGVVSALNKGGLQIGGASKFQQSSMGYGGSVYGGSKR